jgi:HSP20 family protein
MVVGSIPTRGTCIGMLLEELVMDTLKMKHKQVKPNGYIAPDLAFFSSTVTDWRLSIHAKVWNPPTDIFETETKLVVRVEIAGMKEDDFSVRVDQGHLIISGIRLETSEPRAFHRMEINYGDFISVVELPDLLNLAKIEAEYRDGFLLVTLPKAQPKHIKVNE